MRTHVIAIIALGALGSGSAAVRFAAPFTDHAVLQRGKPIPVWGTAAPGEQGTVSFGSASAPFQADPQGNWRVTLPALPANPAGQRLSAGSAAIQDVVVGDVWLCSGQSNMAFSLGSSNRPADVAAADYPGLREFAAPIANRGEPQTDVQAQWKVSTPATAGGFSAVAFYFGRAIWLDQNRAVPIGLLHSSVGGTQIDPWLAPEGLAEFPSLAPLYSQPILPFGPFSLFNGMIHPLAPYGITGAIWYQGEAREGTSQGPDSYEQKMRALARGWGKLFGVPELPFYFVQIANWQDPPTTVVPDGFGSYADTRRQQMNVIAIPHSGMAVAIDLGEAADIHPKHKLEVGERLARWPLRNDYGHPDLLPSGPILKDAAVDGNRIVCSFDYVGSGLMAATKDYYQPARETVGAKLARFSIAGADGKWVEADARIEGNTVVLSSPSVAAPRKAAYAYWMNPAGCNLYNREGLPASPFLVDDASAHHTVTASAGPGGSIAPAGARSLLGGTTALYRIVPDAGRFIADVKVDGVSQGSVTSFTFDPLHADHQIAATFAAERPSYAVKVQASPGGTVDPAGPVTVPQGGSQTFTFAVDPGCRATLTADGAPLGPRAYYTFSDARADHRLDVAFTCPIQADAGFGGTLTPFGSVPVTSGSDRVFTFSPMPGYVVASVRVDGKEVGARGSYTFTGVRGPHALSVSYAGGKGLAGAVPRTDKLIFSCLASQLPASGPIASWPAQGRTLTPLGSPVVEVLDGRRYARNDNVDGEGHDVGTWASPIACQGATLVAVARPVRLGQAGGWDAIVNVFHDRLSLGVRNDSGKPVVLRDGAVIDGAQAVPDGQITILSMVVQPGGAFKVFANGTQIMDGNSAALNSLVPGVPGPWANHITVGRNGADGWSAFNGDLGDAYLYSVALTDAERGQLEAYIEKGLIGGNAVGLPRPRGALPRFAPAGKRFDARGRAAGGRPAVRAFAR